MLSDKNTIKQGSFFSEFFRRFLPEKGGGKTVVLICFALLAAILCLWISGKGEKQENRKESSFSEEYVCKIENRLEEVLSAVQGVGECSVMITLESGVEYVYAEEEKYSSDTSSSDNRTQTGENRQKNYVTTKTSGEETPVVVTEIAPSVKGVAVICQGGGNVAVKSVITEIVSKALGIPGDKIAIAQKQEISGNS